MDAGREFRFASEGDSGPQTGFRTGTLLAFPGAGMRKERTMNVLIRCRALVAATLLVLWTASCQEDRDPAAAIRVMTQNVYYGFDVGPLLAAQDPAEIPILAAQAFQQLVATDFAERAGAMADEIAQRRPHLIGLQEIALIRIQSPGDAVAGGTSPAETVLFDHLEILMSALASRGLDYRVA